MIEPRFSNGELIIEDNNIEVKIRRRLCKTAQLWT